MTEEESKSLNCPATIKDIEALLKTNKQTNKQKTLPTKMTLHNMSSYKVMFFWRAGERSGLVHVNMLSENI